jgi:hypothetical protein
VLSSLEQGGRKSSQLKQPSALGSASLSSGTTRAQHSTWTHNATLNQKSDD